MGSLTPYEGVSASAFEDEKLHNVKSHSGNTFSDTVKRAYAKVFAKDLTYFFEVAPEGRSVLARVENRVRSILETPGPMPRAIGPWKVELTASEDQGFGAVKATAYIASLEGSQNEWVVQIRLEVDEWMNVPFRRRSIKIHDEYLTKPFPFTKEPKSIP